MNRPTPDEEIEKLLGHLLPAAPNAELMARLQAAEPQPDKVIPIFRWLIPIAAAAVLALMLSLSRQRPAENVTAGPVEPTPVATTPAVRTPLESRQHLMEVTDLGVVRDSSQQPVRLIRTTWLDEISYEAKPGSAPEKEARVRQEVMPVAVSTY